MDYSLFSKFSQYQVDQTANPEIHTMGSSEFYKYIGRGNRNNADIEPKKFSAEQCKILLEAHQNQHEIVIVGVYREHIALAAQQLGLNVISESYHHARSDRLFNRDRNTFFHATNASGERVLIISTYPSNEYTKQVALLVKAILSDLDNLQGCSTIACRVSYVIFPDVSSSIDQWTGFSDGISQHIRYGDTVVIGNVEFLEEGLISSGFKPIVDNWIFFGSDEEKTMFGVKVFVDPVSYTRLVLVGIRECFWGSASAHYCRGLYESGAKNILYGSKAASMIVEDTVFERISPMSYINFFEDGYQIEKNGHESTTLNLDYTALEKWLKAFDIKMVGSAITVPTVIGEDQEQRERYEHFSPSCMDCENAHIAMVTNGKAAETLGFLGNNFFSFVPVHFVTDHIYRKNEKEKIGDQQDATGGLGGYQGNPEYYKMRDYSYFQISSFFAAFANRYGVREFMINNHLLMATGLDLPKIDSLMDTVRPLIHAGHGDKAISTMFEAYEGLRLPKTVLIAAYMISQKLGMLGLSTKIDEALRADNDYIALTDMETCRLQILKMKLSSQTGSHYSVLSNALELLEQFDNQYLRNIDQLIAVYRRMAVAYAGIGDEANCLKTLQLAADEAKGHKRQKYHQSCNELWALICDNHLRAQHQVPQYSLKVVVEKLRSVREMYQSLPPEVWWQSNFEKGALSALYLEASYLIQYGKAIERNRGYQILVVARAIQSRIGGGETSEAFGEVLNSINNLGIRHIIAIAMDESLQASTSFANLLNTVRAELGDIVISTPKVIGAKITKREKELQLALGEYPE